jgi:hypothetical protein
VTGVFRLEQMITDPIETDITVAYALHSCYRFDPETGSRRCVSRACTVW